MRSGIKGVLDAHKRQIRVASHAGYGCPRLFRPFDGTAYRWAVSEFAGGCCITAIHKSGQRADDLSLHSLTPTCYLEARNNKAQLYGLGFLLESIGADETNRTPDLLITNQLLYRLSYISEDAYSIKKFA
jgi:hypothetical protein